MNIPVYITLYIICNLTTLVKPIGLYNFISFVDFGFSLITFINLTCTMKLKIYVSWNNTLLDYGIRVIHNTLLDYGIRVIHFLVPNKTDPSCILINRYRLGITESIVSGLIHTKVTLREKRVREQFVPSRYILLNTIELYLDRYQLNT